MGDMVRRGDSLCKEGVAFRRGISQADALQRGLGEKRRGLRPRQPPRPSMFPESLLQSSFTWSPALSLSCPT